MRVSLQSAELARYVAAQINHCFPDGRDITVQAILEFLPATLERVEHCFSAIHRKYFAERGEVMFDHLHSDHYAMFLYLLSNSVHRGGGDGSLATKLFLLNKTLHGLDAYYSIQLPEVFLFVHPVGTVLGNARYGNYFVVYQNCSIGADEDGAYPELGEGVILYSSARIIGRARIGDDVVVAANAFVLNFDVPSHSIVTGCYPQLRISSNMRSVRQRKFD